MALEQPSDLAKSITQIRLEVESKQAELRALEAQAIQNAQAATGLIGLDEQHQRDMVAARQAAYESGELVKFRERAVGLQGEAIRLRALVRQIEQSIEAFTAGAQSLNADTQKFVEEVVTAYLALPSNATLTADEAKDRVSAHLDGIIADMRMRVPAWINQLRQVNERPVPSTNTNSLHEYARLFAGDIVKRRIKK